MMDANLLFKYAIRGRDIVVTIEGADGAEALIALTPSQIDKLRGAKFVLLSERDKKRNEATAIHAMPTHRCTVCGALWRKIEDGTWNLVSGECAACCDNAAMREQIVEVPNG